jgi:hypothetical protein
MGGVMRKFKTIVRRILYVSLMSFIYLTAIPKLANTEKLVITTYYPAPYGGYVSLLTTNNTWLAKDGGNVGIGTGNPQHKLDVNGSIRTNSRFCIGSNCISAWPLCQWQLYPPNATSNCSNWLNLPRSNYSGIFVVAVTDLNFNWFGNVPNGGWMLCCYMP